MNEWVLAALIIVALTALMIALLTTIVNLWYRAKRRNRFLRWVCAQFE